ncbi:MAG: ATP-binding cassette domain-containing protein [Desulfobacterales bacterium]|nr:ATP-binding cassette domain-containing protein [Desulfobacterales bacterium]
MIHMENLTKYYGELCAVDHINLDIHKGEILGLLGPNGAGKTTTIRMMTGFFRPNEGTIRVKDFSIEDQLLEIKKMIGYLPESAPLYYSMLVFDYLSYVAKIRGIQGKQILTRIKELSDLCGLSNMMHKNIAQLSKGYKQRVGLAHAMMCNPEILILDEPTSGLDPNQIVEIREIIRRIGKQKTVILSTHILSEAEATCDRIVIINKGKIVADGKTDDLKHSASEEVILNIGVKETSPESVISEFKPIQEVVRVERQHSTDPDILNFQIICRKSNGVDPRKTIYTKIKETNWVLVELHQQTKTLEHIFRELTRESN